MPHPLVVQLRFTRSEFKRALAGLSDPDARHRFLPMNYISWTLATWPVPSRRSGSLPLRESWQTVMQIRSIS